MTLAETSTAPWNPWPTPRLFRAAWHLYRMLVEQDNRPRHGAQFVVLTEGGLFERNFAAFRASPLGGALIREKPDTPAILADKATLDRLPEGSLGKAYARFMATADLDEQYYSADGISATQPERFDPERLWFRVRSCFTHDINHMLSGYGPTTLGEACLMTFRFAQLRHLGLGVLSVILFINLKLVGERSVLPPLLEAFRRGWKTTPFEMLPWEKTLHLPLASHRSWLGLTPTRHYPNPLEPDAFSVAVAGLSFSPAPYEAGIAA